MKQVMPVLAARFGSSAEMEVLMERYEYGCKNNKMVNCGNRNGCSTCGWDEDTRNRRLTEIRRQRAKIAGLASCPFCGRQPFAIHSRAGYSIRWSLHHAGNWYLRFIGCGRKSVEPPLF